ncbi:hypothetical protein B0H15DRAFT_943924 [Mycena belliarum]|uniref:Secreted protein n=1 Tax=Mycena belliarum TaxID=1033014 RepID=A0AAD6XXX1_9AGAR|nr:hypothetical protein B0H15DRAFT_943924 [Mycena belliae]
MQCQFLVAFVVACFALSVSAAPVAEPDRTALRLPRAVEEAREPEPGCSLYTCIWYALSSGLPSPTSYQYSQMKLSCAPP